MKFPVSILVLIAGLIPLSTLAQLTNGGTNAYFGVDGDTRNNYVKYGTVSGLIATDDWFSSSSSSYSVIDTSNAATYLSLLQGGANLGFNKRMSLLKNERKIVARCGIRKRLYFNKSPF